MTGLSERQWVKMRRQRIGFVFQAYALLAAYSAWENVDLMLRLTGAKSRERQAADGRGADPHGPVQVDGSPHL